MQTSVRLSAGAGVGYLENAGGNLFREAASRTLYQVVLLMRDRPDYSWMYQHWQWAMPMSR